MKDDWQSIPEAVSFFDLLVELQRRLDKGWRPQDVLYFTELSIELIEAYRLSNYRVVTFLEASFALPDYHKALCAKV
jgi:hypothetical protein